MWPTYYPDNGRVGERQEITSGVLRNPTHKGGERISTDFGIYVNAIIRRNTKEVNEEWL